MDKILRKLDEFEREWRRQILASTQIICWLSFIPMVMYANVWQWLFCLFMWQMMTIGGTLGYHRVFSHGHWKNCPAWARGFFAYTGALGFIGPAIPFAAVHQEHHRYHDTEKDPHSAAYKGHWYTYVPPQLVPFRKRYLVGEGKQHFRKLMRDPILQFQERMYWWLVGSWVLILLLTTYDPFSIIYGLLAPAGMLKLFANLLFGYSHRGQKPHNDFWLAMVTLGEGFHKEHHDRPWEVRNHKWDFSGWIIEQFQGKQNN